MSRIIAGRGKGRRLKAPRGLDVRPTGARVRQTLFDILAPVIPGCRFLDACAGSGAVGLEALSRGATHVVFVDQGAEAVRSIRENLRPLLAEGGDARVFRQDAGVALSALADSGERFDVIYLDPPYASNLYEPMLEGVARGGLVRPDGVVAVEHFHKRALPETIGGLVRTRSVRVGDHRLTFYRPAEASWREAGAD